MLVALYLLYRIAYPKQSAQKSEDVSEKEVKNARSVMGKSRFVLPDRSQPLQTPATSLKTDSEEDKPPTFASESEEKRLAAVPPDRLDEAFTDEPDPDELDIPPDEEDEDEIDFAAEETEELKRVQGHEVKLAAGLDFDDLQQAAKVVKEQPETVSNETGKTLAALENTDMFELLVSGDEGKRSWIKAIIDRSIQNRMPETEDNTSATDYGNFEVADFIVKRNKR